MSEKSPTNGHSPPRHLHLRQVSRFQMPYGSTAAHGKGFLNWFSSSPFIFSESPQDAEKKPFGLFFFHSRDPNKTAFIWCRCKRVCMHTLFHLLCAASNNDKEAATNCQRLRLIISKKLHKKGVRGARLPALCLPCVTSGKTAVHKAPNSGRSIYADGVATPSQGRLVHPSRLSFVG